MSLPKHKKYGTVIYYNTVSDIALVKVAEYPDNTIKICTPRAGEKVKVLANRGIPETVKGTVVSVEDWYIYTDIIAIPGWSGAPSGTLDRQQRSKTMRANMEVFDGIMGDCAGMDMLEITADDVRTQCQEWRERGEWHDDEDEAKAIDGLDEYHREEVRIRLENIEDDGHDLNALASERYNCEAEVVNDFEIWLDQGRGRYLTLAEQIEFVKWIEAR